MNAFYNANWERARPRVDAVVQQSFILLAKHLSPHTMETKKAEYDKAVLATRSATHAEIAAEKVDPERFTPILNFLKELHQEIGNCPQEP